MEKQYQKTQFRNFKTVSAYEAKLGSNKWKAEN